MQALFAWDFNQKHKEPQVAEIISNTKEIDKIITKAAPERPIKEINKIDLAILRLSVFEMIIVKEIPFKVIVDEAVELAKQYGGESSASFVNGVLGKIIELKKIN